MLSGRNPLLTEKNKYLPMINYMTVETKSFDDVTCP